jgi:hypothetical protein
MNRRSGSGRLDCFTSVFPTRLTQDSTHTHLAGTVNGNEREKERCAQRNVNVRLTVILPVILPVISPQKKRTPRHRKEQNTAAPKRTDHQDTKKNRPSGHQKE